MTPREKQLKVGYEVATYEKDNVKTEYNKFYVQVGDYKLTLKLVDGTAKEMLKRELDK